MQFLQISGSDKFSNYANLQKCQVTRIDMVRQLINHINLRITKTREEQKPLSKGEVFEALLQQPRRNARQPGSVFLISFNFSFCTGLVFVTEGSFILEMDSEVPCSASVDSHNNSI